MSLIQELKRRNVFRVAIAYVVVAWLILQVVDVVLNNIEAPGWVFQVTLLLLGIGFIVVVIFSWVFELTPEGIKLESEVDRSTSITPDTGRKLDRLITSVLVLAVAYFLVDKFVLSAGREAAAIEAALQDAQVRAEEQAPPAIDKSIAVLPFVNMSEDSANEYFSDGISEEILNALAGVRDLKVAGRTSSFAFKGQNEDLRRIGEALGVAHILEGSVRKAGDRVRITAQLVKVDDGFHLWSDTYDRQLDDVFAIQDEIANAILGELKTALLDEPLPQLVATRADTEAFDLYLLAKQRIYQRSKQSLESAADSLERAVEIDPGYAPAWAQRGIATMLLSEGAYGDIPDAIANEEAKRYLDRALEIDPNLAEGWAGLGLYYNGPPFVPDKAIESLERARELNPSLVNAGNWLVLAYWGVNRVKDAGDLLEEITRLDPFYKPAMGNRVFHLTQMGQIDEAREYVDRIEPFMEDQAQILQTRAWIDQAVGDNAAGLRRMEEALRLAPT
ncbi:MAG: hypothetical protein R3348_05890, partial [Xanthomonadales bacterium]|nr:hypothetical protein [Xanthomonadales bacterium]